MSVEGTAETETGAAVEIFQDGQRLDRTVISLGKSGSQRMLFRVPGAEASAIELKLLPDEFDSLVSPGEELARRSFPKPIDTV